MNQFILRQTLAANHNVDDFVDEADESAEVAPTSIGLQPLKLSTLEDSPTSDYLQMQCRRHAKWMSLYDAQSHVWKPHQLAEWKKRLGFVSDKTVKQTFLATTQIVPSVRHENQQFPKDHHVPRFPMLSCYRLQETVCADIVYLGDKVKKTKPAILFYATSSRLLAIYSVKDTSSAQCLQTVYEFIRDHGCPRTLKSDFANQLAKSSDWKRLTARLLTHIQASEAHKHNQNTVETAWRDLQEKGEHFLTRMGVPRDRKFLLYKHLCDLHNHTARECLNWRRQWR